MLLMTAAARKQQSMLRVPLGSGGHSDPRETKTNPKGASSPDIELWAAGQRTLREQLAQEEVEWALGRPLDKSSGEALV